MSVIQVENLHKRYGGTVAVDDVSLEVRPGEVLGLIGQNGDGKTTFIDAVNGLVANDKESAINLDGASIEGW